MFASHFTIESRKFYGRLFFTDCELQSKYAANCLNCIGIAHKKVLLIWLRFQQMLVRKW